MKTIWAPWRIEYILNNENDQACIFCKALGAADDLTLYKGDLVMVVMNKFPYTNGHLLVAPNRHLPGLDELNREEMEVIFATIRASVAVLKSVMKPDGFNIGLNLGKVAGAGVEDHLHFHIVPRWFGDVNALTVLADVRVIPEHMKATYDKLKPQFEKLGKKI
ncbi:MAG: HIT domain-containing protein [Desulfobacteraceae bacterium]|nr:MAG: HIT domain-containing protein [Desulfobacteraceae bacterium]